MNKKPLINFPCLFPIKIMGINNNFLVPQVAAIISSYCDSFKPDDDIKMKLSTKGNYLSITATVWAQSQDQLDKIYLALNKHDLVKITL